jgi:hypothetical protein
MIRSSSAGQRTASWHIVNAFRISKHDLKTKPANAANIPRKSNPNYPTTSHLIWVESVTVSPSVSTTGSATELKSALMRGLSIHQHYRRTSSVNKNPETPHNIKMSKNLGQKKTHLPR